MIQHQREDLKLKTGDTAYYLVDETYGVFDLVTILGECDEGQGYSAFSPWWVANYPPREEGDKPGHIHTCNNTLVKTKREARDETIRILQKSRKHMVQQQGAYCRGIQYIDFVLSRKGRHP